MEGVIKLLPANLVRSPRNWLTPHRGRVRLLALVFALALALRGAVMTLACHVPYPPSVEC